MTESDTFSLLRSSWWGYRTASKTRRSAEGNKSPVDDGREVLGDERLVVWAQCLDVRGLVGLAVEVVRVERAHGGERLRVLLVHEVRVRVLPMPPEIFKR